MSQPQGDMVLRTLAMPADTNPNGDIFGGWIMSQMDIAGGLAAKNLCNNRISTVAVESMTFFQPVKVGDVVCCYADILKVGRTSMQIQLQVWKLAHPFKSEGRIKVTEGLFTYVAIDDNGRPIPVYPE